jgi:RNA polymerase sigma-70 factor, ECF subfamily
MHLSSQTGVESCYRSYLHYIAKRVIDSNEDHLLDCSDIVQEALLKAHRFKNTYGGSDERQYRGWLRRIFLNCLKDARRYWTSKSRSKSVEGIESFGVADVGQLTPSEWLMTDELSERLSAAMDTMTIDQRDAVAMRYYQRFSVAEISRRMELSERAVAGLIYRGLVKLRKCLDDDRNA